MNLKNTLFFKVAMTLLFALASLGLVYLLISRMIQRDYMYEVNQQLYGNIAEYTVAENKSIYKDGQVDTTAMQDIMHSMMMINPSVEVYLLDTLGNIITYVAPYKVVKLEKVSLVPLKEFIASEEKPFIMGDDPRHPEKQNVFSAAKIVQDEKLQGYIYIILASEKRAGVAGVLESDYFINLGTRYFFLSLFLALALGLFALWYVTRSLREVLATVTRFKEGDMDARIDEHATQDWHPLAETFNEMADTLEANIEQIKSVEKLRQELIANVSHDLRTPLAIMQGYVETLMIKNTELGEEERMKYLNIITSSSHRLNRLIQQLFEYTKLDAMQIEPQKEPFFLTELAHDVKLKYEVLGKKKNISLELIHPDQLPLVFADISLVERVLQNLLDNAIKFTPEGGKVSLQLENGEEGVTIRVLDSGPGIPAEKQSFIFERYQRGKSPDDTPNEGVGLGLAIVKKILELHETHINVRNKRNSGAEFFFSLPLYNQLQANGV